MGKEAKVQILESHVQWDCISRCIRALIFENFRQYKHEMDAQLRKAEMKVDQARSEASMALRAAQQDASQGSPGRLREAQEHEKHALQALAKAELEERHEASVYRRRADGEHRQVAALKGELERIEDKVLPSRKKAHPDLVGRVKGRSAPQPHSATLSRPLLPPLLPPLPLPSPLLFPPSLFPSLSPLSLPPSLSLFPFLSLPSAAVGLTLVAFFRALVLTLVQCFDPADAGSIGRHG